MEEKQLLQHIDIFGQKNSRNIVRDIGRLVAVQSTEGAALPGAPFGKGPRQALDTVLEMAREMGFSINDGQGYVGWCELEGRQKEHIATITHVDVVPAGDGWDADPYKLREKDGWLLGRGVIDDKGPAVLCLYMAKFFKEMGLPLRYSLRLLFGCSEETGMQDVSYYLKNNPQPVFCFTPDADFPVAYGEKGHLNAVFSFDVAGGDIVEFSGGIANNVVPDKATCLIHKKAGSITGNAHIQVQEENGMLRLNAKGTGGHAAAPQGSINAIALLVNCLLENNLCSAEERAFLSFLKTLHDTTDGSALGIACKDEAFGALTIIGGVIKLQGGRLCQSVDIRYPAAVTSAQLLQKLGVAAKKSGVLLQAEPADEPFIIPPSSPVIQTLLKTYNDVTGRQGEPFTMGGGTYARHFKNAVSFGPEEPGTVLPPFAGPLHGANEGVQLSAFLKALKIYCLAVWRLQQLDF